MRYIFGGREILTTLQKRLLYTHVYIDTGILLFLYTLKGFPIHLSRGPDVKKYDPNVFPIKGTHHARRFMVELSCKYDIYVMCTMNPIGDDHAHENVRTYVKGQCTYISTYTYTL